MNVTSFKKALCAFSMFCLSQTSYADAPAWVTINDIQYNGSGCPIGSVIENVSEDKKAFTLAFSEYIAEVGQGILRSASRKNCQVSVNLSFPQGWSYSVVSFDYRGYAFLDRNVTGTQKVSYYFQGDSRDAALSSTITGPYDDDFHYNDEFDLLALVWSPCGIERALNLNTQIRVNNRRNRRGEGFMTLDSIDGAIVHKYGIRWRRCN